MDEPVIAQRAPFPLDLAEGDYWWCACGRSKNQPFCDGSHKGSAFNPVKFTVPPDSRKLWMCGCKRSGNKPYCDGTHNKLPG